MMLEQWREWLENQREWLRGVRLRWLLVLPLLVVLYYGVGIILLNQIHDDADYTVAAPLTGGSHAVDMAAALVERETGRWLANDPWFLPGSQLDNVPNFQMGIVYAVSRFASELADQLGRARGSSQVDADLDRAAGLLKYPGTVWIFDPQTSWAPTATSEQQYRRAVAALRSYNRRVADGSALFERRADNLIAVLDRIASDMGSQSAVITDYTATHGGEWLEWQSDDVFFATKGRIYAYYLLLRELGRDFAPLIRERELQTVWDAMLDSLRRGATLQPLMVVSGKPDSQFMPCHLCSAGFYLLRGRMQLREISDVLTK